MAVITLIGLCHWTAWTASPPAGSSIGNQASATYTDSSGVERTATSNVAITIVQQVASFTLTADNTKTVSPGGQVAFPHTIINTGNGSDSFTLSVAQLTGDSFDLTGVAIYDANSDGLSDSHNNRGCTGGTYSLWCWALRHSTMAKPASTERRQRLNSSVTAANVDTVRSAPTLSA